MLQQKAFRKSNLHLMIWRYNEKDILCTQKYTIFPVFCTIGVTKVQIRYSNNQVQMPSLRNGISTGARFHRGLSAVAKRQHLTRDWRHSG